MKHDGNQFKSVGSPLGDIWVNNEPSARFVVRHPEKPGEHLINPTGQYNPEFWVPMALDLEKKREARKAEEDGDDN